MGVTFDLVVSAENRHYLAWQTQLCCYSAVTRLGMAPTVIVHATSGPLLPEFQSVTRLGCRILETESFARTEAGTCGLPRNLIGSLLTIADQTTSEDAGHVLICEPDMLFVRPLEYDAGVSAEFYSYVDYTDPYVLVILRRWGLEGRAEELNATSRVGVPYLVPRQVAGRLARRWLAVFDSFETLRWTDMMPAFGIAAALEEVPITVTRITNTNTNHDAPVTGQLIHYCYGDITWNKRSWIYRKSGSPLMDERLLEATPGSVLEEILVHVREARAYF